MFAPSRHFTGGDPLANAATPEDILPDAPPARLTNDFAELCRTRPLDAVAEALRAYKKRNPEGYTCTFIKQERINDQLHPQETIACAVREVPFSVLMRWEGGKRRADATLYVAGENDNSVLIIPSGDLEKRVVKLRGVPYAKRTLSSSDVKGASRYTPNQFGIYKVTAQVYAVWKQAADAGTLTVTYRGVQECAFLPGKTYHVLERTSTTPDDDGATKVTIYLDTESHLLHGSILEAQGELLGQYYYRDIQFDARLNANHFNADQFR
jgi:hypothetical protein